MIVLAPEYREPSIAARAVNQVLDHRGRVILLTGSAVTRRDGIRVLSRPVVPECVAPLLQAVVCDAMIGAMVNQTER